MNNLEFQPELRPALPEIKGCKEYREERALFIHIDQILQDSGLQAEFIALFINEKGLDAKTISQARINHLIRNSIMAFRGNIARLIKKLSHREFCKLLPDSTLLRWFIGIERMDAVKAYAKSSSDRYTRCLSHESLQYLNQKLISIFAQADQNHHLQPDLAEALDFETVYFDSTCLKAPIHYPTDWVLLRDLTRSLMKATSITRREGLTHRMPQAPLEFLSDMNTQVMKMTATNRIKDGKKKRKNVMREMRDLARKIKRHAQNHLDLLKTRSHETNLSPGRIAHLTQRIQSILDQVDEAIHQACERLIGERQVKNESKIFSLYDTDINCITRAKSQAQVEFGNKLWLGETQQGLIVDYLLEQKQTGDTKHVLPALKRLTQEQNLPIKAIFGDRGLSSTSNEKALKKANIYNGLCPKNVTQLSERLAQEPELKAGLKRRASTEARIKILTHDFLGETPRAKGFSHREMAVGWAVLTHNLWLVARLAHKEPERATAEAA